MIVAAHDAPIAIGLATDNDDMNVVKLVNGNRLVAAGLEIGGVGFDTVEGMGIDVVLDQLVVPVDPCRHGGVLMHPLDQLLFGIEAAAIDELLRGDGVEYKGRWAVRVEALQHIANVVLPVICTKAQIKGCRSAAAKDTDRALVRLESMLYVEGDPRAALLVLGER